MIADLLANFELHLQNAPLTAYVTVYLAGLLVSFTPCVYPVIPLTVAYIGGRGKSHINGFILSLFYVLGTAITYTALGAVAALSGSLFGTMQSSPWTNVVVANICILLGLSMLGVFSLHTPESFKRLMAHKYQHEFIGALLMGAVAGLIMGPCTAPVLGVVLGYVATHQNIVYGMSLLFVFSLGMGTILIALGTFAGLLKHLPKAGNWMVWVQRAFGFIFIAMGEYFLFMAGQLAF